MTNTVNIIEMATWLSELPDEEFKAEIDPDMRRRFDEPVDDLGFALRHPIVVRRYLSVLLRILKSIEGQLASADADHEAKRATLQAEIAELEARLSASTNCTQEFRAQEGAEPEHLNAEIRRREAEIHKAKAAYMERRARIIRFKSGVEDRSLEMRHIVDGLDDDFEGRIDRLCLAIHTHRISMGDDPSPADLELWSHLELEGWYPEDNG